MSDKSSPNASTSSTFDKVKDEICSILSKSKGNVTSEQLLSNNFLYFAFYSFHIIFIHFWFQFAEDYHSIYGNPIPFQKLGFANIKELLRKIPGVASCSSSNGSFYIRAIVKEAHTSKLVHVQKDQKRNSLGVVQDRKPDTRHSPIATLSTPHNQSAMSKVPRKSTVSKPRSHFKQPELKVTEFGKLSIASSELIPQQDTSLWMVHVLVVYNTDFVSCRIQKSLKLMAIMLNLSLFADWSTSNWYGTVLFVGGAAASNGSVLFK